MELTPLSQDAARFWIETQLREALNYPENIGRALAILKVSHEYGDSPQTMMQKILADFVFTALKVPYTSP